MFENRVKSPDIIVNKLGSQQLEFEDLLSTVNGLGERLIQGGLMPRHSEDLDLVLLRFTRLREALALPTALMPEGTPVIESDLFTFQSLIRNEGARNIGSWNVSSLGRIREVRVSSITQEELYIIAALSQMEKLSISNIGEHVAGKLDCAPLAHLEKLTVLRLDGGELDNFSFLESLGDLTDLTFEKLQLTNLTAVENLTQLTSLSVGWNPIEDLTGISGCTRLRELDLSYCNEISDLSPLARLSALETLHILIEAELSLEVLLNLPALQYVSVSSQMAKFETNKLILNELDERKVKVFVAR